MPRIPVQPRRPSRRLALGCALIPLLLCLCVATLTRNQGEPSPRASSPILAPTAALSSAALAPAAPATARPTSPPPTATSRPAAPTAAPRPPTQVSPPPTHVPPAAADNAPGWPTSAVEATLLSVTDGDTIRVSINGRSEPVRLIGIDTPELVDPRKPVQCFAREASNYAKELLTPGLRIGLEPDPTQDNHDKYDRLLRYAWLPDGRLFNLQMIAAGYAHEYTYDFPYKYQSQFRAAERQAREAEIGLWSPATCGGNTEQAVSQPQPQAQPPAAPPPAVQPPAPANPGVIAPPVAQPPAPATGRTRPQGSDCPPDYPIKGNRNSMIYHTPSSRSYAVTKPEECFATEADALAAGYRAPRN